MADENELINSTAGGSDVPRLPLNGLYLNPNQSRDSAPTAYENELADAIEAAYADNIHELSALVDRLNETGPRDPDGNVWTKESYAQTMAILAK